jgi:hypothetical protein
MVNYIEKIIDSLQAPLDNSYLVFNAVNTLDNLYQQNGKYNILFEIQADNKEVLDSEYNLNRIRKGNLQFMAYIGTTIETDSEKTGSALSKQAVIWNDLLKKYIDYNWSISDTDSYFKLVIHNTQLIDYYPINNQTNGKLLIGITGNVNYSLIRL